MGRGLENGRGTGTRAEGLSLEPLSERFARRGRWPAERRTAMELNEERPRFRSSQRARPRSVCWAVEPVAPVGTNPLRES
jgi:hypothetical protein